MNEVILELAKVGDLQEIEDQTLAHGTELFSRISRELYRAQMITKAGGPEALEWIELPLEEPGPSRTRRIATSKTPRNRCSRRGQSFFASTVDPSAYRCRRRSGRTEFVPTLSPRPIEKGVLF